MYYCTNPFIDAIIAYQCTPEVGILLVCRPQFITCLGLEFDIDFRGFLRCNWFVKQLDLEKRVESTRKAWMIKIFVGRESP